MSLRRYDYPAARVSVHLNDGRVLEAGVTAQRGDFTNPRDRDELLNKFRALAGPTLGSEKVELVIESAGRLDSLTNIGELAALLLPGA